MEDWLGNGAVGAGGGKETMIRIHSCHLWERSLHLEPGTGWFRTDDGRLDAILNLDVMNCLLNKAGLNFSSLKKLRN
jgi:hypothetical protein